VLLRINARFVGAIEDGAEIAVAIVTKVAIADESGGVTALDLTIKSARRFLENAALIAGTGVDIEVLNQGRWAPRLTTGPSYTAAVWA
jgi:hypothetical protein